MNEHYLHYCMASCIDSEEKVCHQVSFLTDRTLRDLTTFTCSNTCHYNFLATDLWL